MEKLINELQKLLPGEYVWHAEPTSMAFRLFWNGKLDKTGQTERAAVCTLSHLDLINYKDVIELAYKVRDDLLAGLADTDSDLVMDMITGKI